MRGISYKTAVPEVHASPPALFSSYQINFSARLPVSLSPGRRFWGQRLELVSRARIQAVNSVWEEKPFEVLPNGKKSYFDEQDVVTFLDPPQQLIPLDPASYNPAAYLWKKIEDIPRERHDRLLQLLKPRLISRAWEIAGTRYKDPKLVKKIAQSFAFHTNDEMSPEFYKCRTSGGPLPVAWNNYFKKVIFSCGNGKIYGRFIGGPVFAKFVTALCPLYFEVTQVRKVMSTEQPCDLAYELGDGLLDLHEYPQGFPRPAKHPYPFNDRVVVFVRQIGPGVSVGQAWQEGEKLEQVPRKFCGEILMVKEHIISEENN